MLVGLGLGSGPFDFTRPAVGRAGAGDVYLGGRRSQSPTEPIALVAGLFAGGTTRRSGAAARAAA